MKSIRKKVGAKMRKLVFGAFALIVLSTIAYIGIINPLFSHAASQYISAVITDDNGSVDFSPSVENALANFSYIKNGDRNADSKIYDVKIAIRNLPISTKKVVIKLPVGMIWVDDGASDENLRSQLNSSMGTNGIETTALEDAPILNYNYPDSGYRTYYLSEGTQAVTLNMKVKADMLIDMDYIENAIEAKLFIGETEAEAAHLNVSVPNGRRTSGKFYQSNYNIYVLKGETHYSYEGYYRMIIGSYLIEQDHAQTLFKEIKTVLTVDDPSARIVLMGNNPQYTMDDSRSSEGIYTITRKPSAAVNPAEAFPYAIVIPDNAPDGKIYTVTGTGEATLYQIGGTTRTINFSNTQNVKYQVLPSGEKVTLGLSGLNPTKEGTAYDIQYGATTTTEQFSQGALGVGRLNNRGGTDSAPKRMKMEFDTSVLGVMGVELVCQPNGTISTVHVETKSGVSKDVTVNRSCNASGFAGTFTYSDFGLEYGDYISKIEYDLGVIPAATQIQRDAVASEAFSYVGRLLRDDVPGIATIEVFDINNPSNTTGVAKIITTRTNKGSIDITNLGTQIINAGASLKFTVNVTNWAGTVRYNNTVQNPVIYIRQEAKDAAGNYLPISNLTITNGPARGDIDITSLFGQVTYEDTATARIYKIDGHNVPDGLANLMSTYIGENGKWYENVGIKVSWTVNTDMTTPDQKYQIADMVFVHDPDTTVTLSTHGKRGDPFGLSGDSAHTIFAATNNYYQIRGWASIGVDNAGKHTSSDTWLTWSEESNPITIGSAEGSLADMKATMINNSGVAVPGPTTIYFPIPKKNQNWNSLSYNNQNFEFSTALTGAISNPNNNYFVIYYGKDVTPSDNGTNLEAENAKFTTNTSGWTASDWEDVNCIKITATNIPANQPGVADNYDFIYKLKVVDATNASDGAINTWRPLYFQQLTNSAGDIFAGWYKGSYVSVKLADGKMSGQIFIDSNENGKKDSGEQDLKEAGWKVDLYDKSSNRLVRSTTTDENGKYSFIELAMNADGYYITVTNKHPINGAGVAYLFTPKGTASNAGAYNTDNQAEGSKTSNPIHATAYVGPISPSDVAGEATYNIGVVEYIANENYSGTVTFNDRNNEFSTRPASVVIVATASDGTTTNISVPTNGNRSWTKELPRYSATGAKLTYNFSTADIANYAKTTETTNNGHTFNASFNLKTATLTVHHYKKGTTEKLANDEISTVYWGQTYVTSQASVDSNYEYDSIVGDASGPVAGDVVVTYYYKLKTATITTHYYIKDTTDEVAPDVVETKNYTEDYETHPLANIPARYQDYELVSDQPADYRGTVGKPAIDVTYYYQKKDPKLSSSIKITAPETVSSKNATINYDLQYSASIKDYIGATDITIVVKLPYPIVIGESELSGAAYDANNKTLTWIQSANRNTYTDGEDVSIERHISLVYDGAKAKDRLLVTAEATIALSNKDNDAADSAETIIKTPSKIVFRYIDENGVEIQREQIEDGFVGDVSDNTPPEIPGYKLIRETPDLAFGEEEHVVIYRYEKIPESVNPKTIDGGIAKYFILVGVLISGLGCGGYIITKRKS
ncbi:MucBP domain-containing protein [Candidatus Saccharibacteria bacterium]|nr:MucBP domain-containing protein [Candidatus Saccharibacteria bacterium]